MARPKAVDFAFLSILFLTQTSPTQAKNIERQSSENNLISSGTCYYAAGQPADPSYIPCGNTAFGNFHCCEAQSNCLDNNACYDGDAGTTYLASCTDSTYQDPSCPNRGIYSDQQWSGLVYCNGTSDEWTLCDDSSAGSNLVVAVPGCYCPEDEGSRNFAFSAGATLGNQVMLPATTGESMSLFPGYTPGTVLTSTPSPAAPTTSSSSTPPPPKTSTPSTSTSGQASLIISTSGSSTSSASAYSTSTSSSTTSSTSTTTSSQSSSSSSSTVGAFNSTTTATSSLSTGEKAGIGVGAAVVGLGLIALLSCLAVCLRRRKRRSMFSEAPINRNMEVQPMAQQQYQSTQYPQRYSPAWSTAAKSELPGDGSNSSPSIPQSWSRPLSEAEGSYPTYQSMASLRTSELYQPANSSTSQGSYRPGRRVEGGERGVYEMPAQMPGSTMM